jgi:predicted alpha/beta hydrolase family esterase
MGPFLILHGWQGSGPGHWQTWLAGRLRAQGAPVAYPDLPDADAPSLEAWLDRLEGELRALARAPVVLCHSLSCLLWLHHAERGGRGAERILFVAPPSESAAAEEIATFFPAPLPHLEGARLVCSDDDPHCPEGAAKLYGEALGIPVDLLPGTGHLNPEAGYGPWPAVEAWAREERTPVTA